MNPIIREILEKGLTLTIGYNKEEDRFEYTLGGFYKSDTITLIERAGYDDVSLMAIARYKEHTIIHNFDELVMLNYSWWKSSQNRFDGWNAPNGDWLPFFLEKKLVEVETKIIYK